MSQSVKLKDGSYIDASGVWDVTQGKSQEDVNASLQVKLKTKTARIAGSDYTFESYGNGKYRVLIPLSDLIGEYTTIYSYCIDGWSSMLYYLDILMVGKNMSVWTTSASVSNMIIWIKFLYV